MKKAIQSLLFVMVVFSCAKQERREKIEETGLFEISSLTFNFTVNSPGDTKTVKTGWETGDKVFVFFSGLSTGYVTFEYGASSWCEPVVSGTGSISPEGTLTAVYLPFGNDETPSHGNNGWSFEQIYYSYYLVSQNTPYTIDGDLSTLSATIMMENPEGYVQFFVEDEDAINGAYTLQSDAIWAVGLRFVGDNGIITEKTNVQGYFYGTIFSPMPGFAYHGGYLFSGKLIPASQYVSVTSNLSNSIDFVGRYYFVKTKVSDSSREDYCTSAATLTSHFAGRLPANGSTKWVPVGSDKYADLGGDVLWATCNYLCNTPEDPGLIFTDIGWHEFGFAASGAPYGINFNTVTFPERDHVQWLIDNCTAEAYMILGQVGMVMKSTTTDAFIFLPCTYRNYLGSYLTGVDLTNSTWWKMDFDCRPTVNIGLSYINYNTSANVAIRTIHSKDGIPLMSSPFDEEVEI